MVGRVCVPVPIVAGMTRVLKIQEKDFMRNAMDTGLRRYDGFFCLAYIDQSNVLDCHANLTFARNDKGIQNAMDSRLRGNDKGKHEIMGVACAGMTEFFV